jgi:hypothetical protein
MMASEKAWQLAPEPVQEAKTSTQLSSFLSPEKRREEKRREEKGEPPAKKPYGHCQERKMMEGIATHHNKAPYTA